MNAMYLYGDVNDMVSFVRGGTVKTSKIIVSCQNFPCSHAADAAGGGWLPVAA